MSYAGDLTPQETWDLLASNPNAVLVDVRTRGEWESVGVPTLVELNKDVHFIEWATAFGANPEFLTQLKEAGLEPGSSHPILFLCRSGNRSIGAAIAATQAGFGPSYNVLEGFEGDTDQFGGRTINGWRLAGLPSTTLTTEA